MNHKQKPMIPPTLQRHALMITVLVFALLVVLNLQAGTVTIDGKAVNLEASHIVLISSVECAPQYCDQFDTNCDGALDEQCPGLEYDICTEGSIVWAYIGAAFTGECVDKPPPCVPGELVLSPSLCGGAFQ